MKNVYIYCFLCIFILLTVGCGEKPQSQEISETQISVSETYETPTIDEITDETAISDDLSVNDIEDDYGDII